ADGRAYANLTVDNSTALTASGTGTFQFQTLLVNTGSSFTFSGSSAAAVKITGNITSSGSGNVALTSGTGGIAFIGGSVETAGGVTRTVAGRLRTAGPVPNAQRLTVNGTLELDAGGSVSGSPTYGSTAALDYEPGTFAVGGEWGAGTAVGVGVPLDVTINAGSGTVSLPASDRDVPRHLTLAGGTL